MLRLRTREFTLLRMPLGPQEVGGVGRGVWSEGAGPAAVQIASRCSLPADSPPRPGRLCWPCGSQALALEPVRSQDRHGSCWTPREAEESLTDQGAAISASGGPSLPLCVAAARRGQGHAGRRQWRGPGHRRRAGAGGDGAAAPGSRRRSQRRQPLREAPNSGSRGPRSLAGRGRTSAVPSAAASCDRAPPGQLAGAGRVRPNGRQVLKEQKLWKTKIIEKTHRTCVAFSSFWDVGSGTHDSVHAGRASALPLSNVPSLPIFVLVGKYQYLFCHLTITDTRPTFGERSGKGRVRQRTTR